MTLFKFDMGNKMDTCGFMHCNIIKVQVSEIRDNGNLLVRTYSRNGKMGLIPKSLRGEYTSVVVGESLYVIYLEELDDYLLFAAEDKLNEINRIAKDFEKWSSNLLTVIPNIDLRMGISR